MTRENMIAELSKKIVRATPTVYTYDMGLQFDFVTPEGVGTCLGSVGEWPIIFLKGIEKERWLEIRKKIEEGLVNIEDFQDTSLEPFANAVENFSQGYDGKLAETFKELRELPEELPETFYCLYDIKGWEPCPLFYTSLEDLLKAFRAEYCGGPIAWEDLSDDEIKEWYDRIEDDLSGVARISFGFSDDDEEE